MSAVTTHVVPVCVERDELEKPAASRLRAYEPGSLDHVIYEGVGCYRDDGFERRRLEWIADATEYHLETSPVFRRLADSQGFSPTTLRETGDLSLVPLLSSGTFKRTNMMAATAQVSVRACTSSGTRGSKSIVPRDQRTLERFVGTITHALREFVGPRDARKAFILGPSTVEAQDLWFAYSIGLAQVLYDTEYFVQAGRFDPERLYNALAAVDRETTPALIAPPTLLLEFLRWMEARDLRLHLGGRESYVLTAGGWKKRESEAISREDLTALVGDRLDIRPANMRDVFNMVELNSLIFECEHHRKHVPPWLAVVARRPKDLTVASPGEEGLLTYLDPTPTSYPGFIFSDDFGSVVVEPCRCRREGMQLRVHRRLSGIEERGCALKMERYAEGAATEQP